MAPRGCSDRRVDRQSSLEANGEGGASAEHALVIAPVDPTGTVGPPCYWSIINKMRPSGGDPIRRPCWETMMRNLATDAVLANAVL